MFSLLYNSSDVTAIQCMRGTINCNKFKLFSPNFEFFTERQTADEVSGVKERDLSVTKRVTEGAFQDRASGVHKQE